MPGPRRSNLDPIADALLEGDGAARVAGGARGGDAAAALRGDDPRLLAPGPGLPGAHGPRRDPAAVAVRRGGARGGQRRVGAARGGALRAGRDAAVDVPAAARRAADDGRPGRRTAGRDALRHRPRRLPRGRALPGAAQALGAAGADALGRAVGRGGAARGQRAAAAGGDVRAARDLRDVRAGRVPARRRARRAAARAGGDGAQRAVAGDLPAAARRRVAAERDRHRDLPDLPAEVQVRARLPDSERADDQPALRDPRPPGARALPRRRRVRGCRSSWGCSRPAGGAAASAIPRRSASSARRRPRRWSATTTASARRTSSRSGSSAPSSSGSARTSCAGAWTAWTACPTAATS